MCAGPKKAELVITWIDKTIISDREYNLTLPTNHDSMGDVYCSVCVSIEIFFSRDSMIFVYAETSKVA